MILRVFVSTVAAFALSAGAPTIAPAQGTANQKDAAEMKAYRLTMDGIRRLSAAGEAMMKAVEADPRYKAD